MSEVVQFSQIHAASECFIGMHTGLDPPMDPPRYMLCTPLSYFEFLPAGEEQEGLEEGLEEGQEEDRVQEESRLLYPEEVGFG